MASRTLAALALFAGSLAAQSPPCASLNDANTTTSGAITAFGFAGEEHRAWQYTPATSLSVLGGRLFTGNTTISGSRFMKLEIHGDAGGQPGARIAGGTWKISGALGVSWQGTNFDLPAVLSAGTPYWIVWTDPGFSAVPEEPGGIALPLAYTTGTSTSWTIQPPTALKFRLYCSFLDDGNVSVNGAPCPNTAGQLGTAFTNQQPQTGNADFAVEGTGLPANTLTMLLLGTPTVPTPVPGLPTGCLQYASAGALTFALTGTGTTRGPTAAGHVAFPLAIPGGPVLVGLVLGAQIATFDAGAAAALPFSTSNGLGLTLF